MIAKIIKVKNLGLVFQDYTRRADLSDFKQSNLIYGWNGTGKTTLTRLFEALSGQEIKDLEYEVEDVAGKKHKQNDTYPSGVRVFNQNYIQKNVKILESRANSISILLGEENKELTEQIEDNRKILNGDPSILGDKGKVLLHGEAVKEASRAFTERGEKFTAVAKTIGQAIGGNALRTYRKGEAEKDFNKITEKTLLSSDALKQHTTTTKQESQPALMKVAVKEVEDKDGRLVEAGVLLESINRTASTLLTKTVVAETIHRLSKNNDIAKWAEEGMSLHKKHGSSTCEFCMQEIPATRIKELAGHFNDADKTLKEDIDIQVSVLQNVYVAVRDILLPENIQLYSALQAGFESQTATFEVVKEKLLEGIKGLGEELKSKKSMTTEEVVLVEKPSIKELASQIVELNKIIDTHNKTTDDFDSVKAISIEKLKTHYLSDIYDEVKTLDQTKTRCDEDAKTLSADIALLNQNIADAMAQISSDHKACDEINEKLAMFLGHKELSFVPHTEMEIDENGLGKEVKSGYDIMRGEKLASDLSEGEKTAIAFVYFVVHLSDQEFDIKNGIIVVDDPISSLDSNSLYQAFSFLKNAVIDSKQVFILTHNFDFLKLLINWRQNVDHGKTTGFYMIKNHFPGEVRCATIEKMDKELCDYESEYHYLFKVLKELSDSQDDTIAKAYPIPNIARKVWDTFLTFSVPNGRSQYAKIEELKKLGYDAVELDTIYKFTNDQSHITGAGFDPALVAGTKKAVKSLFQMMKKISPEHFKIINETTS